MYQSKYIKYKSIFKNGKDKETIELSGNGILEIGDKIHISFQSEGTLIDIYYSEQEVILKSHQSKLKLVKGNAEEIGTKMKELLEQRRLKQPLEYPSAGSVFKRPIGHYAGELIEKCGLKGYRIGDAEVSEKHAGFIINKGCATSNDILKLIAHIKSTVFNEYGVELESEIRFIGD